MVPLRVAFIARDESAGFPLHDPNGNIAGVSLAVPIGKLGKALPQSEASGTESDPPATMSLACCSTHSSKAFTTGLSDQPRLVRE